MAGGGATRRHMDALARLPHVAWRLARLAHLERAAGADFDL